MCIRDVNKCRTNIPQFWKPENFCEFHWLHHHWKSQNISVLTNATSIQFNQPLIDTAVQCFSSPIIDIPDILIQWLMSYSISTFQFDYQTGNFGCMQYSQLNLSWAGKISTSAQNLQILTRTNTSRHIFPVNKYTIFTENTVLSPNDFFCGVISFKFK